MMKQPERNSSPKIAFVYDRVNKFGGAERVLTTLHRFYPDVPLYTLVYNPVTASWAKDIQVVPSFFNRIKWLRSRHQLLAPVAALGFETFNLDNFDIVVSITSESAKAVLTKPQTLHICYCLTPTRYLWQNLPEYQSNWKMRFLPSFVKSYLKFSDKAISARPDHYIAISAEVQKRIKEYYQRDSRLIYPPLDCSFWSKTDKTKASLATPSSSERYYLVVSRLEAYKKVDLVISAFNQLCRKGFTGQLKVVGSGSQKDSLICLSAANPKISFLGQVSDTKLRSLYQNASALIFPQVEDFGLTALESQAAGTPVIALKAAGAKETVINKETGLFFKSQTVASLLEAIGRFESGNHDITKDSCRRNAAKFDQAIFIKNFKKQIEKLWQMKQDQPR